MKTNDLVNITSTALATAALTVLTWWPGTVDAGDDAAVPAQIPTPKFVARGLEFTLATADGRAPKANEAPVFSLKAVSLTNVASTVTLRVAMSASSPASALSRAIMMPAVLWTEQRELKVGPGETEVVILSSTTNLPVNKFISVSLQDVTAVQAPTTKTASLFSSLPGGGQLVTPAMVMLNFSTVIPGAAPALLTSR